MAYEEVLTAIVLSILPTILIISLGLYVYFSLTLMLIAKRTHTEYAWLAWVPIVGKPLLSSKIAKMHWWPVLLFIAYIIPILNVIAAITITVYRIIWLWKICEKRHRPGWWSILLLIPGVNIIWAPIMMGILAWSKD
ncbi:hypothetical protein ACFL0W_03235 [Nanoarchaeota archaeon]